MVTAERERSAPAQTEQALAQAQAEVSRLEGRRTAMFAEFRAAAQDGDGLGMLALRREWEELAILLAGAKIRMQRALVAHLEPQVQPAHHALKDAERRLEEARNRLPFGRAMPDTNPKLIAQFTEARYRFNFKLKVSAQTAHHSYEAWRESIHDDLVLATSLACWPSQNAPALPFGWLRRDPVFRDQVLGSAPAFPNVASASPGAASAEELAGELRIDAATGRLWTK